MQFNIFETYSCMHSYVVYAWGNCRCLYYFKGNVSPDLNFIWWYRKYVKWVGTFFVTLEGKFFFLPANFSTSFICSQTPFLSSIFMKLLDNIVMNQKRCSPALGSNANKFCQRKDKITQFLSTWKWKERKMARRKYLSTWGNTKSWKGTFPWGQVENPRGTIPFRPTKPCLILLLWPLLF